MPGYAPIAGVVGVQPFNELMIPDTTQRNALGMCIDAVDPYFGGGKFMYLKTAGALDPGRLVIISDETFAVADLATTANLGSPFLVARASFSATGQYGWFQYEGVCPLQVNASVAQGAAIGIGAAGKGGTNSAGKQLMGVRVLEASTFTLTKTGATLNGSKQLGLPNVSGLFYGLAVSGTGVAASTTITAIDPSGRYVTLNNAMTATASVTITFTYTNFVLAQIMNPHTQGAIT